MRPGARVIKDMKWRLDLACACINTCMCLPPSTNLQSAKNPARCLVQTRIPMTAVDRMSKKKKISVKGSLRLSKVKTAGSTLQQFSPVFRLNVVMFSSSLCPVILNERVEERKTVENIFCPPARVSLCL